MLPDWRLSNPYQTLLSDALRAFQVHPEFPPTPHGGDLGSSLRAGPRPDIVHLHWPNAFLTANEPVPRTKQCIRFLRDILALRRTHVKIVWTVHNLVTHDTPIPRFEVLFSALLARLSHRLIVHSEAAKAEVAEQLKVAPHKITLVPHGSFREAYGTLPEPEQARQMLGMAPDQPVALFVGMIRPYKGVIPLLKAWQALGQARGNALLVIAGNAPDLAHASEIKALAETLPQVVLDMRYLADDELPPLLAAANVLVLPFERSLTSGTVRLAQDYGIPVVVPRVAGTADIGNAIFAENTTPAALSKAILEGLSTQRYHPSVVQSWADIAQTHAEVYRKVL